MKRQNISRKLLFSVILLGLITFCAFFYETILIGAGGFLAPKGMGNADVVILEGEGLIREKAVKIGIELLSSGNAKRMVVVLQQNEEDEKIFALPDYSLLLVKNLQSLTLRKDQLLIIDGLVKSPSAALRCNFVVAAHP